MRTARLACCGQCLNPYCERRKRAMQDPLGRMSGHTQAYRARAIDRVNSVLVPREASANKNFTPKSTHFPMCGHSAGVQCPMSSAHRVARRASSMALCRSRRISSSFASYVAPKVTHIVDFATPPPRSPPLPQALPAQGNVGYPRRPPSWVRTDP